MAMVKLATHASPLPDFGLISVESEGADGST
jgi:hypothetical protein